MLRSPIERLYKAVFISAHSYPLQTMLPPLQNTRHCCGREIFPLLHVFLRQNSIIFGGEGMKMNPRISIAKCPRAYGDYCRLLMARQIPW